MKKVTEIMHGITVVGPDTSITDVSKIMAERNIGSVLIKKDDKFGIITERDIIAKVISQDKSPGDVKISEIMTALLITIDHTRDVSDASKLFIKHNIRRLPVVKKDGKIIGIITTRDVVRQKASDLTSKDYHRGMYQEGSGWG